MNYCTVFFFFQKGDKEEIGNVEYSNRITSSASAKRKLGKPGEVTMEERLGNLCIDMKDAPGIATTSILNPHNLSHLLVQVNIF